MLDAVETATTVAHGKLALRGSDKEVRAAWCACDGYGRDCAAALAHRAVADGGTVSIAGEGSTTCPLYSIVLTRRSPIRNSTLVIYLFDWHRIIGIGFDSSRMRSAPWHSRGEIAGYHWLSGSSVLRRRRRSGHRCYVCAAICPSKPTRPGGDRPVR